MSPVIDGAIARTDVWAWVIEHGWADEQAVPEPVAEAYTVDMTAAEAGAWTTETPAAASRTAVAAPVNRFAVRGENGEGPPGTLCS
ncbi:hypothetical protein GCM10027200_04550 [Lentzea nigeriaca]